MDADAAVAVAVAMVAVRSGGAAAVVTGAAIRISIPPSLFRDAITLWFFLGPYVYASFASGWTYVHSLNAPGSFVCVCVCVCTCG